MNTQTHEHNTKDFAENITHDLRSPLRSIGFSAEILLEDYESVLDEDGNKLLLKIIQNTSKINSLLNDFLLFARLSNLEKNAIEINLNDLVKEIYMAQIEKYESVKINHPCLPSVFGDYELIKQLWTNLISNAFKFSSQKEKIIIEIGVKTKKNQIIYFIKDNGIGFDEKYSEQLFEPFKSLHPKYKLVGSGLGLAIAKKIVEAHGGKIWAESKIHQGATFYFHFDN